MKDVGFICAVVLILEVCFGLWLKHEGADTKDILTITFGSFVMIGICEMIMFGVGILTERW